MRDGFLATLDLLSERLPHTPIFVLSGLATGSDQLAVHWATDWAQGRPRLAGRPRLRCVGVLPLDRDDYLRDFEPGNQRDEFELTERLCAFVFALPDPDGPGVGDQDARDRRYRDLGLFIARQSDVLVAFWDGKPVLKTGGTADVINLCTAGGLRPIDHVLWEHQDCPFQRGRPLLIDEERVPVVHAPALRLGDGSTPAVLGPGAESEGVVRAGDDWVLPESFVERERVNRHLVESAFVPEQPGSFARSCLDGDERWDFLQARRRHLSGAASAFKHGLAREDRLTIGLFVLGILLFQVFSSLFDDVALEPRPLDDLIRIALVLGYLGFLGWGVVRSRAARRRRVDFVQATLRAVGEGMRIQAAMLRAHGRDVQVGNWMSARTCRGTEPLRSMLRACVLEAIALDRDRRVREILRGAGDQGTAEATSDWVDDQIRYFGNQLSETSRRSRRVARFRRVKRMAGGFVFCVAVAMLVFVGGHFVTRHGLAEVLPGAEMWVSIGTLLIGVSLAIFAGIEMAESSEQTSIELEEFRRMRDIFGIARRRIELAPGKASEVVQGLGKEAIAEVAEWYVRNRERAVETKLG